MGDAQDRVEAGALVGQDALTLAHPEPPKRARRGHNTKTKHWPPTTEREASMRRCLSKLADAREAAGWPGERVRPTTVLRREQYGRLALRLHQLHEDGEPDPEGLLVAVFQAKVHQHRNGKSEHQGGIYCNAESLCRDSWWPANLAAGRAWLASGGRPAAVTKGTREVKGGRINSNGSFTPTGRYTAADIFEET